MQILRCGCRASFGYDDLNANESYKQGEPEACASKYDSCDAADSRVYSVKKKNTCQKISSEPTEKLAAASSHSGGYEEHYNVEFWS